MNDRRPDSAAWQNIVRRLLFDHTVLVLALLVVATTAVAFWHLNQLQNQLVAAMAVQGTRLQAETLEELRTVYTAEVVEKVRGHGIAVTHDYEGKDKTIPLPASLTMELGRRMSARGSGLSIRLYSEYPFPWRKDGGPHDAFERDALNALKSNPKQPFYRMELLQGQPVLRYAVADLMRAPCISCHNTLATSPKTDWKVGDVRGVLEFTRSFNPTVGVARSGLREAFGWMTLVAALALACVGVIFGKQRQHARRLAAEVAERKRVEEDLMASVSRAAAMDEASPLGTFVTDAQQRCLHLNPAYEKITGYSAQAVLGSAWSAGIHPDDRDRVLARWRDALGHDRIFDAECRFLRADGSATWVSCKAAPMMSGGQLLGYVGTLEDISERKNVERMKNEFVSTVSHELRTPLTSIMGSLGLLAGGASGALSAEVRTLVDIARKNSERLVRLINDILDIEKIESGRMQFELLPRELQPLVEQAVAANRAYAEQFGVSFAIAAQLPGAKARVDADGMMQVMTNLMANAAKFSPHGATVELRLGREGDMIRLAVSDRGPGIPESFRDKVFEKFSQADASDSRKKGGTGLGLSITKAIVEAMGGSIGFVTGEGQGTTFYFDLPEWVEPEPVAAPVFPTAAALRPRVLVCEDDRDVATLLCMMLGNAGYNAVPAYDAASARRLLAEHSFVAMTLDIRLPDLDGRALLRELRADPATRELPIVVVSANLRATPRADEGDGLGVVDWIPKPIDPDRLLNAMRRGTHAVTDGRSRVLHVEDDPDLRHVVASLCAEVAEFEGAASFREAAELLSTRRYDLVILDVELPDRSGWDLLPLIDQQAPPPQVLVFSGSELSAADSGRVAAALVKSHVSNPELLEAIRALTGKAQ
ncbi:MAG: response regulator [Betaproteobacteria bacterium]|nr:response regulator [Betaproteobacteria bacterium]